MGALNKKPTENVRSTSELDKLIGERVRARRMEKHVSQTSLAAALGITFQQIQKYEKGTNRIGAGRLVRIAQLLECEVSDFCDVGQKKKIDQSSPFTRFLATKDGLDIMHAFMKIKSKPLRRGVIDLARRLEDE